MHDKISAAQESYWMIIDTIQQLRFLLVTMSKKIVQEHDDFDEHCKIELIMQKCIEMWGRKNREPNEWSIEWSIK